MTARLAGLPTTTARRVRGAVRDATLAASVHNSQPWRFVVSGSRVEVWLDPRSRPTVIDPDGRWTLESLGAAAANLELGLRCRLERPVRLDVLPGMDAPDVSRALRGPRRESARTPVAIASWGPSPEPATVLERNLHAAVGHRHTTRGPLYGELTVEDWNALNYVVRSSPDDGSRLDSVRPDAAQTAVLLEITAEVDKRWRDDAAYLAEMERWSHVRDGRGVPYGAYGPRDAAGRVAARDFSVGVLGDHDRPTDDYFEVSPQLLVITSASDDAPAWVRSGRAMQRAMLAASARGLGVGVLGQVVE
ncbi:hypothetical protein, partial [Pengzhenrongella sp.]|uniref:hypothetical protein n=1 Tax=Pengzhenrongella sp. TaxID=2888820 RepID=UPI002F932B5B